MLWPNSRASLVLVPPTKKRPDQLFSVKVSHPWGDQYDHQSDKLPVSRGDEGLDRLEPLGRLLCYVLTQLVIHDIPPICRENKGAPTSIILLWWRIPYVSLLLRIMVTHSLSRMDNQRTILLSPQAPDRGFQALLLIR